MKQITFSDEAKADIRAIPQHLAINILTSIHRLADSGTGRVKTLQGKARTARSGFEPVITASASPRSNPAFSAFTLSSTERTPIGEISGTASRRCTATTSCVI